jgi:hypothetical protein
MILNDDYVTLRRHKLGPSLGRRKSLAKRLSLAPTSLRGVPLYCETTPFNEDFEKTGGPLSKIAESTFAEVFLLQGDNSILKLMPLACPGTALDRDTEFPLASDWSSIDHEHQVLLSLRRLEPLARYNVPTMHTGFSLLQRYVDCLDQ